MHADFIDDMYMDIEIIKVFSHDCSFRRPDRYMYIEAVR